MSRFLIALFAIVFVSCNNLASNEGSTSNESENMDEVKKAKQEVMDAHDRVMPLMTPMGQKQRQLMDLAKQSEDTVTYVEAIANLREAQKQMMDWMHMFQAPDEQDWTDAQKIDYLDEELEKMMEIEQFTKNAIDQADILLKQD